MREWLKEVIIHVRVWTGFALGSVKFARGMNGYLHRFVNLAIPITPKHNTPKFYNHPGRGPVRKVPENGGKFSKFNLTSSRHVFIFSFRTDVIHFILNEFFDSVSPSSPWFALEAGKRTFILHFYTNLHKKLPDIRRYMAMMPAVEIKDGQMRLLEAAGFLEGIEPDDVEF